MPIFSAGLLNEGHPTDDRLPVALADEILTLLTGAGRSAFTCAAALEIAAARLPFVVAAHPDRFGIAKRSKTLTP